MYSVNYGWYSQNFRFTLFSVRSAVIICSWSPLWSCLFFNLPLVTFNSLHLLKFFSSPDICIHQSIMASADFLSFVVTTTSYSVFTAYEILPKYHTSLSLHESATFTILWFCRVIGLWSAMRPYPHGNTSSKSIAAPDSYCVLWGAQFPIKISAHPPFGVKLLHRSLNSS